MITFYSLTGRAIPYNPSQYETGYLPSFLDPNDPRSAAEQIDANYAHGGGWRPMSGHTMNANTQFLKYPGDPALAPIAHGWLRHEQIVLYNSSVVAIIQPDGSFQVARVD